ncbi:MAG: hypothetical protein ABJM29_07815 [Rhizobiaceae bacterium]
MKLKPASTAVVVAVLTAIGCAKRPNAIAPATVPVSAYRNLNCQALTAELSREQAHLKALSKTQHRAATADAIGVFLVLIPAGSVTGNDNEGEIAESKGKVLSIQSEVKAKNC